MPGFSLDDRPLHPKRVMADPVARLQSRLDKGEVKLQHERQFGYLRSVLRELHISPSSQLLILSKTSLQKSFIGPQTPRAVYFTDDVAVGFVLGSDVLEFAATDPKEGVYFYNLRQWDTTRPRFESKIGCLNCHKTANTFNIQGLVTQSVFPDHSGTPAPQMPVYNTSHETPLKNRWGGWYVTGTTGEQLHMGNSLLRDGSTQHDLETEGMRNWQDLNGRIDTRQYLTPYSDVVALMVLEHQARMVNLILRATDVAETAPRRVNTAVEELLQYMLFIKEERLTTPIIGTSGFSQEFTQLGPRDRKGRSLRDFDLRTRMFRYPCSYMIYSDAFDAMPTSVRDQVYRRLWEVLTGKDTSPQFTRLSPAQRKAILEILRDTKRGLPSYWFEQERTQRGAQL